VLLCICGMSWYYPYPNGQPYPIGHERPPQGFVPGMVPPPPVTFYPHQHEHQQHEQHEQHHHHHHRKKKSKKRKHGIVLPPQGTTDPNPSPTHHANKHEKKRHKRTMPPFPNYMPGPLAPPPPLGYPLPQPYPPYYGHFFPQENAWNSYPQWYHTHEKRVKKDKSLKKKNRHNRKEEEAKHVEKKVDNEGIQQTEEVEEGKTEEGQLVLSQEVIAMFAKSELRRREREKKRAEERKKQDADALQQQIEERTNKKTESEKLLPEDAVTLSYGVEAQTILNLEAGLNLIYDRVCDYKQPILWPTLPLSNK